MTLTELRYVVAVAREKHFGRAAEACFVSQPTLSVSIKKLEEELDVKHLRARRNEVSVTPLGDEIVRQAQAVIEAAAEIKEIAKRGKDPLSGPLRLGVIYTIGPYLLPELVKQAIERVPQMPLMLQENFTVKLLEHAAHRRARLRDHGRALSRHRPGDRAALRRAVHGRAAEGASAGQAQVDQRRRAQARDDAAARHRPLLSRPRARGLPGVRALRRADADGIRKSFEGSSLETIKYMVASGMGVTVVPQLSVPAEKQPHVVYVPFDKPAPTRRVVLAWRRSFTRYEAIAALRNAIYACELKGVKRLTA